jgi:hypothetical protein
LAQAEAVAEDAAAVRRMDRKRVKRMSIQEWMNPNDLEPEITRLKDGRTALGAKSAVPLADRAIGNLQQWLIGTSTE